MNFSLSVDNLDEKVNEDGEKVYVYTEEDYNRDMEENLWIQVVKPLSQFL